MSKPYDLLEFFTFGVKDEAIAEVQKVRASEDHNLVGANLGNHCIVSWLEFVFVFWTYKLPFYAWNISCDYYIDLGQLFNTVQGTIDIVVATEGIDSVSNETATCVCSCCI